MASIWRIEDLMEACITAGASDIHLTVGSKPALRKNTSIVRVETATPESDTALTAADTTELMHSISSEEIRTEFNQFGSSDFSFHYKDGTRFRVSIFKQRGNCALTLRRIPSKILGLNEIGLPDAVVEVCRRPRGLFLVTGPTGSGKTTTLASLIDHINESSDKHILTFEDPIEYYHTHKRSLVNQREIRVDVPNFAEALRRGLRQDPDVILVGEMRDLETMQSAISAAETGHLVFGTLHTSGASSTINRIVQAFPAGEQAHIMIQLAGSLIGVLSQTLCPRIDKDGMVGAYEYLHVTSAVQSMIRDKKPFQIDSDIQTGKKYGMQLLDDHLKRLVDDGIISRETAIEKSRDSKAMEEKFKITE